MPVSTQTSGKAFNLPTGQEVYDRIMGSIEPELVTDNLQTLDAPYKNETLDDRKARYQRYGKAFKVYRKRYNAWLARLDRAIHDHKKEVIRAMEHEERAKEDSFMALLEQQILAT